MSDQQLVTGLAILISGYSQLRCGLSFYHWQIITTLSWYSSITHIATLLFLRQYLQKNKFIWYLRVSLMAGLTVMLAIGILPTGSSSVLYYGDSTSPFTIDEQAVLATPARCFFDLKNLELNTQGLAIYVIFSEIILLGGLLVRLIGLHPASRRFSRTLFRTIPGGLWKKGLLWTCGKLQLSSKSAKVLVLPLVVLSLVIFVAIQALLDFLCSEICGVSNDAFSLATSVHVFILMHTLSYSGCYFH